MIKKAKKYTMFYPLILSRHPSHGVIRRKNRVLPLLPFRSVVRLGSTTFLEDDRVECNSVEAIRNSANKLLMKQCFTADEVKTAKWIKGEMSTIEDIVALEFPLVLKHIFGSRGTGNYLVRRQEELETILQGKTLANYIFEKFYNYSREYRLHVTEDGCFYTCRKMLKSDTAEEDRWFRNDSNSVWIVEENESFDKPVNWDLCVSESVKALKAVGLDVGAVDLRIQSKLDKDGRTRENPDFIIVEINSAPSFGEITAQKYIEEIPKILKRKFITNV